MGKEHEQKLGNQEGDASEALKKLAFYLRRYKLASGSQNFSKVWREIFGILAETVRPSFTEIKNQFFPDKILKEILSPENKEKSSSSQT